VINGVWFLGCAREALAQRLRLGRVRETQARILMDMVRTNRHSAFGRLHGFSDIRSPGEYRDRVPLSGWEDFSGAVERVAAGETCVLTEEPVLLFEPTGGTSGAKLVPYTRALKRQFSRGIDAWVFHLFRWRPGLMSGCAYFSITPFGAARRRTACGIPVGFEDDSAYLGGIMGRIGDRVLAVPRAVARLQDPDTFRYLTLLFLLGRRDLALVSVWNPSYLSILLGKLDGWWERLVRDVETGRIHGAPAPEPDVRRSCERRLRPRRERAAELRGIFRARLGNDPLQRDERGRTLYEELWPRLRVISCWADANAEVPARHLQGLFPHADLQPKGLLSTEAFVSFPLGGTGSSVLSLRSHFFEFIDTAGGAVRLAHELTPGGRYEVVVTTGGGLYRYRTRDIVEVTGAWGGVPMVRFTGRADMVSDLFGEKLAEAHVGPAVVEALDRNRIRADFWMVAPERCGAGGFYALFIQTEANGGPAAVSALRRAAQEIEAALRSNPQYAHCLRLGQLGPLRVFRITGGAAEDFLASCAARGQRLGDIKPPALHPRPGWTAVFRGELLS
jgi:hypothetical protein